MQRAIATIERVEHYLRWAAIGVTAVVVAGAMVIPPLRQTVLSVMDELPPPAIAIGRGYEVVVGEKEVRVYGDDLCSDNAVGCLNLSGRAVVTAHLSDGTTEQWSVRNEGRRVFLTRPNGDYVKAKL